MNMKKVCASCLAMCSAIAMLAGLSGCGGGVAGVTDTKKDKGLATLGQAVTYNPNHLVNNGKPVVLEYWSWGDAGGDPIFDMIKSYTKIYPNVKITTKTIAWDDYWTKLPLALKGTKGPALFNVHNSKDALIRPYAADYQIDKSALEKDYITATAHEDGKGHVKYVDSVMNTGNIYYNKNMWKEAGLTDNDIPKTWDEFRVVAKKLTKWDGNKLVQAGFNINGNAYSAIYQGLNYQRGVLLFDKTGKKANFDNPITKENMRFLKDLYEKDKVGSVDFGNDNTQSFGNGQTAMVYCWGWLEGQLKDKYPDIDYGIFPTPTFSKDTPFAFDRFNGESTPSINAHQSKEQQAVAQDFIHYILANDEFIRSAAHKLNSFPAKESLKNDAEILKAPVMAAIGPRASRLIWPGPTPATVETSGQKAFQNVMQNGQSIDQAIKEGQAMMEKDMKSEPFTSAESKYEFFSEHK